MILSRIRTVFLNPLFHITVLAAGMALALSAAAQGNWTPNGPDGGDARAFAAVPGHPEHLYLGTTSSQVYESTDGGGSWRRLVRLNGSDNLILDDIVVDSSDSQTIFVGAYRLDRPDGGLFVSHDAGKSWSEVAGLHGQSIRSLAQAPSNARVIFAGTLDGVFRSGDGGANWTLISPAGSKEIHEVESLAVDPQDPRIVYAGTWHLPWKTEDGGEHWTNIKNGVIDDSDVFSIIINPEKPGTVYASACSGIYKSLNSGELFHKIQGIPATARRTRVLMQDPEHPETVYAGTTEGLYKTLDGGKSFRAMTGPEVIVNDVYVDSSNSEHVLLATDRGGVLSSHDGGKTFVASNRGFSARKVEALLIDNKNPSRWIAGVLNDKSFGGAFLTSDAGAHWKQIATGLGERDVFALAQAPEGTVLAGTDHGIFQLDSSDAKKPVWRPRNSIANTRIKAATQTVRGQKINLEKAVKESVVELDGRVSALDMSGEIWLAATNRGLLTSADKGATWQGGPVQGGNGFVSVAAQGKNMVAARLDGVVISRDGGRLWFPMVLPTVLTRIHRVAFTNDGSIWLGAREGVYFTTDLGHSWMWVHRLPLGDIDDLWFDRQAKRILVSSRESDEVFSIDPKTMAWSYSRTGYRLGMVRAVNGKLVAASLFDGVITGPVEAQ